MKDKFLFWVFLVISAAIMLLWLLRIDHYVIPIVYTIAGNVLQLVYILYIIQLKNLTK